MANKDTAKTYFNTGDFPTESQFAQVFEWLRWKDELIGYDDLDAELQAYFNTVRNSIGRIKVVPDEDYEVVDGDDTLVFKTITGYRNIVLPTPQAGRKLTFILSCDASGFEVPLGSPPVLKFDTTVRGIFGENVEGTSGMITIQYYGGGEGIDIEYAPYWQVVHQVEP